jgi:hypothetical protein
MYVGSVSAEGELIFEVAKEVEDPVSYEPMKKAVTCFPCGHTFNEETVKQLKGVCPLDRKKIDNFATNWAIRNIAEKVEAFYAKNMHGQNVAPSQEETYVPKAPAVAFGAAKWAYYVGDVGKEPPLPSNIVQIMESPCPIWPGKKIKETFVLCLRPKTINGRPYGVRSVISYFQQPKQGHKSLYTYCDLGLYTDVPLADAEWFLLSRDVLPGSRGLAPEQMHDLVVALSQRAGVTFQIPKVLDTVLAALTQHVESGAYLFGKEPQWTETICQEKYSYGPLRVGGYSWDGLKISRASIEKSQGTAVEWIL